MLFNQVSELLFSEFSLSPISPCSLDCLIVCFVVSVLSCLRYVEGDNHYFIFFKHMELLTGLTRVSVLHVFLYTFEGIEYCSPSVDLTSPLTANSVVWYTSQCRGVNIVSRGV